MRGKGARRDKEYVKRGERNVGIDKTLMGGGTGIGEL